MTSKKVKLEKNIIIEFWGCTKKKSDLECSERKQKKNSETLP